MSYRANIYILGLIEFDREEVVLKRDQLKQIEKRIDEIVTDLKGEKKDERKYLPYRVWSLPESKLEPNVRGERPRIRGVKLGYYHHRIILSISAEFTKSSFENLREMRDIFHKFFRENIVKDLISLKVDKCGSIGQDCTIIFIYTYPFFVVENGDKLMEYSHSYEDTIYSDATTAFLFKIPDSSLLLPKNHFVRVSIPFTLLYCSGRVGKELFWNIINAIYFGGLYKKKSQDRELEPNKRINEFDEEILVDLSRLMPGNVSQMQFSVINMKFGLIAIIFALFAIIISIIK